MSILIGADLVPTESNAEIFSEGNAEKLVGKELKALLDGASYRIFNLETPLADALTPIAKSGPNLIAPTSAVKGYKALGVDLLTLSNNHILDQGVEGMKSTKAVLDANSIAYVGVGDTPKEAAEPYIFSFEGKKIGVYACSEREFSIVTESAPGANPFDSIDSLRHISRLSESCDFTIVLYHGGKEHYRYPSPDLQRVCRGIIDSGANLVVCQHSHCIGCEEKYNGGTVVYGQGNFLFDRSKKEEWKTSLLIKLDDSFDISYIPLVKNGNKVALANDKKAQEILDGFFERSKEILSPQLVEAKYKEFGETMLDSYLGTFSGRYQSFPYRALNKLTKGKLLHFSVTRRYNKKKMLKLLNIIECEAHRELIISALKKRI